MGIYTCTPLETLGLECSQSQFFPPSIFSNLPSNLSPGMRPLSLHMTLVWCFAMHRESFPSSSSGKSLISVIPSAINSISLLCSHSQALICNDTCHCNKVQKTAGSTWYSWDVLLILLHKLVNWGTGIVPSFQYWEYFVPCCMYWIEKHFEVLTVQWCVCVVRLSCMRLIYSHWMNEQFCTQKRIWWEIYMANLEITPPYWRIMNNPSWLSLYSFIMMLVVTMK